MVCFNLMNGVIGMFDDINIVVIDVTDHELTTVSTYTGGELKAKVKRIYFKAEETLEYRMDVYEKDGKWYAGTTLHLQHRKNCPFCEQKANYSSPCTGVKHNIQSFFKEVISRKPYRLQGLFEFPELGE